MAPEATFENCSALIVATPSFFDTLGVSLRAGRAFTPADGEGAPPVAIVDEAFATKYFGGGSPLGRRAVAAGGSGGDRDGIGSGWR